VWCLSVYWNGLDIVGRLRALETILFFLAGRCRSATGMKVTRPFGQGWKRDDYCSLHRDLQDYHHALPALACMLIRLRKIDTDSMIKEFLCFPNASVPSEKFLGVASLDYGHTRCPLQRHDQLLLACDECQLCRQNRSTMCRRPDQRTVLSYVGSTSRGTTEW